MTITNQVMKRLVVHELQTTLAQELTLSSKTVVERLLPHLYIQGEPLGTITLRIKDGSTTASETTLDLTEIMLRAEKTKANYHGYISFVFPRPPILKAGTHTIELEANTYTYNNSVFVGWLMLPSNPSQISRLSYPHDFRLVEIKAP